MTFFSWLSARSRGLNAALEPLHVTEKSLRVKSTVPDAYLALHSYLDRRHASLVVLTFGQIESLLGCALPDPAHTEPTWWTGGKPSSEQHTETWTKAHRSATPNLLARTVAFERL
jgi:hypothetical protein